MQIPHSFLVSFLRHLLLVQFDSGEFGPSQGYKHGQMMGSFNQKQTY